MKLGITTISGFTRDESNPDGLDKIQRELDDTYRHNDRVEVYDLRTWKADMQGLADLMQRDGITHCIIAAYSHGAGYAAPRLAEALNKHGIPVPVVIACDPVYRPLWLPRWTIAQALAFRALIPKSAVIKYPANVGKVVGVRQENNIPRAHPVIIEGRADSWEMDLIDRPIANHSNIDDSFEYRKLVFGEIANFIAKQTT